MDGSLIDIATPIKVNQHHPPRFLFADHEIGVPEVAVYPSLVVKIIHKGFEIL